MIIIHGHFAVLDNSVEKLLAIFETMQAACQSDPGMLFYQIYRQPSACTAFVVVERWESRDALIAHLSAEHTQRATAEMANCLAAAPTLEVFDNAEAVSLPDLMGGISTAG